MNEHKSWAQRQNPAVRLTLQIAGWVLVVLGIAALVLPGPGLLMLFAGLALLSQELAWAQRFVTPVKHAALRGASEGVQSWLRICGSLLGVAALVAVGLTWGLWRTAPSWWPLDDQWWLPGGWGTAGTLFASAAIALGLLIYSFRRFRGSPYVPYDAERPSPEDDDAAREHDPSSTGSTPAHS